MTTIVIHYSLKKRIIIWSYIIGIETFCMLFGTTPDCVKVRKFLDKHMSITLPKLDKKK